jgi:uncharacterized membrane protein YbhN (UPF0104 family)
LQISIGVLVSLVCLVLAFRSVPLDDVGDALARANYWWLLPSLFTQVIAALTRARRWQVLLGSRASFRELFWAQGVGFLFTNVFPLRAGEAARIMIANRRTTIPIVQLGLSVVVERVLDLATVLVLLGLVLMLMPVPSYVQSAAEVLGAVTVLACLAAGVLSVWHGSGLRLIALLSRWLPERLTNLMASRWHEVALGLEPIRQPVPALRAIGWSLVIWAAYVAGFWAIIEAFVPGAAFVEPTFATVALAFGVSVPSSPGFIGVFQLVGQQALVAPFPDRYTPSAALSIALVANVMDLALPSLLGVFGLLRLGVSIGALRRPLQSQPDPEAA